MYVIYKNIFYLIKIRSIMFQKYIGTTYIILLDKEKNIYLDVTLVDFTNRNLFFTDKKSNYVLDLQSNEISKIEKKTTDEQIGGNDDFDKNYNIYYHKLCKIPDNFFWNSISIFFQKETGKKPYDLGQINFYREMELFYKKFSLPLSSQSTLKALDKYLLDLKEYLHMCFDARSIYSFNIVKNIDEKHDNHFRMIAYQIKIINILLSKIEERLRTKKFGNEKWIWETIPKIEEEKERYKKQQQLLLKSLPYDEQKDIEKSKKERDNYKQNYLKFIGSKFLQPSILKTGVLTEQEGGNLEYRDKFHKYYHTICDPTSIFFHETISKYFSKITQKTVKTIGHEQYYTDMYDFYTNLNIPSSPMSQLSKVKQDLIELLNDLQLCFDERMIFTFSIINYLDEAHDKHYKTLGYRIKITKILLDKINDKLNLTEFGNEKWLWDTKLKNFTKIEDLNPDLFEDKRIELFNKMPNDIRENIKKEEKNRKKYKLNILNIPDTQLKSIDKFKPTRIRINTLITRPSSRESIQSPWKRMSGNSIDSLESMFSQEEFPEIK
jgi:hypothetical protein